MIRSTKELTRCTLSATDGEIGLVKDFLFDEEQWTVRYLVADTKKWLPGSRKVVISPISLGKPNINEHLMPVDLSLDRIKSSPTLDEKRPISRRYEEQLFRYYGYAFYWMGPGAWGMRATPERLLRDVDENPNQPNTSGENHYESHDENHDKNQSVRSCEEVKNYRVNTETETIGHVVDFIINDETWKIDLIVVNTRNWWPGGEDILISPDRVKSISWSSHDISVNVSSEKLKNVPEFDSQSFMSAESTEELDYIH